LKRIRSGAMPSRSEMIWRNVVAWPCPWSWVPTETVTVPVGSNLISACSISPALEASTVLDMPSPRSLPRRRASARRAGKPA